MLNEPGGGIADTQVALQGQRREPGLRLADQINRQKPYFQPQLGALEQGAGNQRGLVMAGVALEGLAALGSQHAVGRAATARANKPRRPASPLQRRFTLRLGPELPEKLEQRHPGLKLNSIHRHDTPLLKKTLDSVRPLVTHLVSLAEDSC